MLFFVLIKSLYNWQLIGHQLQVKETLHDSKYKHIWQLQSKDDTAEGWKSSGYMFGVDMIIIY